MTVHALVLGPVNSTAAVTAVSDSTCVSSGSGSEVDVIIGGAGVVLLAGFAEAAGLAWNDAVAPVAMLLLSRMPAEDDLTSVSESISAEVSPSSSSSELPAGVVEIPEVLTASLVDANRIVFARSLLGDADSGCMVPSP